MTGQFNWGLPPLPPLELNGRWNVGTLERWIKRFKKNDFSNGPAFKIREELFFAASLSESTVFFFNEEEQSYFLLFSKKINQI